MPKVVPILRTSAKAHRWGGGGPRSLNDDLTARKGEERRRSLCKPSPPWVLQLPNLIPALGPAKDKVTLASQALGGGALGR